MRLVSSSFLHLFFRRRKQAHHTSPSLAFLPLVLRCRPASSGEDGSRTAGKGYPYKLRVDRAAPAFCHTGQRSAPVPSTFYVRRFHKQRQKPRSSSAVPPLPAWRTWSHAPPRSFRDREDSSPSSRPFRTAKKTERKMHPFFRKRTDSSFPALSRTRSQHPSVQFSCPCGRSASSGRKSFCPERAGFDYRQHDRRFLPCLLPD